MTDTSQNPILIKLQNDAGSVNLFAYVVAGNGTVVETTAFNNGTAALKSSKQVLQGSRVFVGAGFPEEYEAAKINAYSLVNAGAYQVPMNFTQAGEIIIQHLPPEAIVIPRLRLCDVTGNVSNALSVNGVTASGPVCKARVHVCTVNWVFRWPIWLQPVIPLPILGELKEKFAALTVTPPASNAKAVSASNAVSRQPQLKLQPTLQPLPSAIHQEIQSATTETIQQILYKYAGVLYPYFCWWPFFWPWFYRVTEEEVVYTDCNGHFDAWLVSLGGAAENIYVWVEANIDGHWVTVYDPPFPCNTSWNYACGTPINIALNNPAIPPCSCNTPVVDGSAWFTAIGAYGITANIQQDVTVSYSPGGIRTVGCTNLEDPNGNQLCPFGGSLGLYLAFGPTLPATHYRWSQTLVLDSGLNAVSGAATASLTGPVQRYYLWPLSDGSWESDSISLLDTDTGGNIAYKIPLYDVSTYPGVSPLAEWVSFNFLSATLDSGQIPNGYVVRLDLELLNLNAAGVFEAISVPVSTFQVSRDTNTATGYDGSVPAPFTNDGSGNNYLTLDPAIPGNALSLSLKVRVDNAAVTGNIEDVWLLDSAGNPIPGGNSNACGFIQFSNTAQDVRLSFDASEPFNFARFSYSVSKGDSGASILGAGGYVFENAAPFTLSGGLFTDNVSVASLLGSCTRAAFSESLTVTSLATDGTGPLWETGYPYYASESNAFALTGS